MAGASPSPASSVPRRPFARTSRHLRRSPSAATSVTFSWTVSDEVFVSSYLHVWANVTIGNETIPLLTDQAGATSVVWTTRDVADSNVVLRVDVEDPFGAHGSASQTFALTRQSPIALIAAVLIAVVLLVFLIFGLRRAR